MDAAIVHARDRACWDAFVSGHASGHILQSWEWGEIKAEGGWRPIRLVLHSQGHIQGAAQVLVRSLPFGFGRLAYVPKGPVIDWRDPQRRDEMIDALRRVAAEQRVIAVKVEPEILDGPVALDLHRAGLQASSPVQMRSSIWVDLTTSEEEMLARQKQKTRYNIRLAARRGVTVERGSSSDLDAWYEMYRTTAQRDAFTIHTLDYYRLVLATLEPRGMARLLLARHEGDLLAGIIVFCFGARAQYMYGASSNSKRNLMAPYLVQWEGMRWAKQQGAEIYDLWGIPDRLAEDEDLWGVYRHKRGYGGETVRYIGAFDLVHAPLRHLALERAGRPLAARLARLTINRAE